MRGASLRVLQGRGAQEGGEGGAWRGWGKDVERSDSSWYLGFPSVLLQGSSELLWLLSPGTAHGDIDALHVLLQVHHHLWL